MINLKVISLRWMYQDGNNFCNLVYEFKKLGRPAWFGHEFMVALFKTNFDYTQKFIIKYGLVPFVFYFVASQMYSSVIASVQTDDEELI